MLPTLSPSPLYFPFYHPFSPNPYTTNFFFFRRSCLFALPRKIHIGSCYLASLGSWNIGLVSFAISNIHLRVSTYCASLSGSGLPHSGFFFLVPSICLQVSRCHCILPLSSIPLCKCTTLSLSILWLRGILFVFSFWLLQIMLL